MIADQPVVLSTALGKVSPVALALSPTATESYWYEPDRPPPARLVAIDRKPRGAQGLRRRAESAQVLSAQTGAWLARRRLFDPLLSMFDAGAIELVPLELHDADGPIGGDWVLVHVTQLVSVDRTASTFGPHPEDPSREEQPLVLRWAAPPTAPLFRLREHPLVLCASRPVFRELHRLSKKVIVEALPPYSGRNPAFFAVTF